MYGSVALANLGYTPQNVVVRAPQILDTFRDDGREQTGFAG
jgi:hypothetical protein